MLAKIKLTKGTIKPTLLQNNWVSFGSYFENKLLKKIKSKLHFEKFHVKLVADLSLQ